MHSVKCLEFNFIVEKLLHTFLGLSMVSMLKVLYSEYQMALSNKLGQDIKLSNYNQSQIGEIAYVTNYIAQHVINKQSLLLLVS